MHTPEYLSNVLIFLAATVAIVPISRRLGLSSILGYLIAGLIIGPYGFKWITNLEEVTGFSEFGVVFLLFLIGIELSPQRLWVMRKNVFKTGFIQVFATAAIFYIVTSLFGFSAASSLVIGISLSLSSTAFALQLLAERSQLTTHFGRKAFGILLFQDLAAIPLIALLPALASQTAVAEAASSQSLLSSVGRPLAAILIVIVIGRLVLRHVFRAIALAKTREVFTAAALLLVLGVAWLMHAVGLSMALGAFLAGVLLSESEYRHELEADIEPFKGMLLGLFFIAVGMSVDYRLLLAQPLLIVGLVIAVTLVKMIVLFFTGKISGLQSRDALSLSVVISQGGEFAFVVFAAAITFGLIDKETAALLVFVVTLSMALTPFLAIFNDRFLQRMFPERKKDFDTVRDDERKPIIIAGFGRVGQIAGRVLRAKGIPFTALDVDQQQVDVLRKFGNKVFYGDASRLELLQSAGAANAGSFVLAIDDVETSIKTAALVRKHFPQLKIYARARNRSHAYELLDMGIEVIHRETLESSISLTRDLLIGLGYFPEEVDDELQKFREHDAQMLLEQAKVRNSDEDLVKRSKEYAQQLTDLLSTDEKL